MSAATIGSALAEKRRELGLEKGRAANKIGMSRTTYSSYEQDAQRPSVDVFPALASFLDISIEELLTLYGATCVAALRPSLEQVMSNPPVASIQAQSAVGAPQVSTNRDRSGPEVPLERLTLPHEKLESLVTVVTQEVSEVVESEESTEVEEVREEVTAPDREARTEDSQGVGVSMIELSHLLEESPKSDSREKSSGHKKKKKKKQKKN